MNINGTWLEEAEINALFKEMQDKIAKQDCLLRSIRSYFYTTVSWREVFEDQYINLYGDIGKPEQPFNVIGEEYIKTEISNNDGRRIK